MSIQAQVHDQFKIFVGSAFDEIGEKVARFAAENKVAAKSIGVEYLEGAERLIVTLGYHTGGDHYPIRLNAVSLGEAGSMDEGRDFADLERRMSEAAQNVQNIICHELFVTTQGELVMVFMTLAG